MCVCVCVCVRACVRACVCVCEGVRLLTYLGFEISMNNILLMHEGHR